LEEIFLNNFIYDVNENVYVQKLDAYGKIIDCKAINSNTVYMVVFDDGTWSTFHGMELNREEF
jgi:hypothetical protein